MYSPMGWSPAVSISAATGVYSLSLPAPHIDVIPVIRLADQLWNTLKTFSISPVTTQLSLLYISTDYATALYIIPWTRTVALVFASTLLSSPTASAPSSGFGTPLPNCCYYIWLSALSKGTPPTMEGTPHWYGVRPYFPWSSVVGSRVGVIIPLPACSSQRHSAGCSDSPLGLGARSALSHAGTECTVVYLLY